MASEGTMRDKPDNAKPDNAGDGRKARLAVELRANLQKRKAQARARRAGDADSRPEGISAAAKPGK